MLHCHRLKGVDSAAQACECHLPEKEGHRQIGERSICSWIGIRFS